MIDHVVALAKYGALAGVIQMTACCVARMFTKSEHAQVAWSRGFGWSCVWSLFWLLAFAVTIAADVFWSQVIQ